MMLASKFNVLEIIMQTSVMKVMSYSVFSHKIQLFEDVSEFSLEKLTSKSMWSH